MSPLDLTQRPPRSPREEIRGLCMLPRMIDIARAKLPGGRLGEYQIGRGVSRVIFASFRIDAAEFVQLVHEANCDEDVARALWQHRDVATEALNTRLCNLTVADVPADLRPEFQRLYGSDLPPDRVVFDVLEADDAKMFAATRGESQTT